MPWFLFAVYCRNIHVLIKLAVSKDYSSNKEEQYFSTHLQNDGPGSRTGNVQRHVAKEKIEIANCVAISVGL